MKKAIKIILFLTISFSFMFGINIYANDRGSLNTTLDIYGNGTISVHECINGRMGGNLLTNEEFIRYIPKSNENTKIEIKSISVRFDKSLSGDIKLAEGNGEEGTYIVYEDESGYYIKSNIPDYEYLYYIGINYHILNSFEEGDNSYYVKQELYNNERNTAKLESISLSTTDHKGTSDDEIFTGIWSKGGAIDLKEKSGYSIGFDYKLDDTDKVEIVRRYSKSRFKKVEVTKKDNTITEKKLQEENWFDAYIELDDYMAVINKINNKNSTFRNIFNILLTIGMFTGLIVFLSKILGGDDEKDKRNNIRLIKWPSAIDPSYIAVATEQIESRVVLTMIFELINKNVLKIRKSEYFGYINNWDSYVVKLASKYNKLPSYLEIVAEKIKELSNERELTIVHLKELIEEGYFEAAYIKCKSEYESMEPIEIEKWNKYKGKLIYSDVEDYRSMDNYSLARTHLYSIAMGMDINEILKYINYNLESPYVSALLIKNEESESIADFFSYK